LSFLAEEGAKVFGFPFVIKATESRKARDVWAPKNQEELDELLLDLLPREKAGESFFAQEFIKASQRLRVLTVGGKAIGAITRPTKWRRRFIEKVDGEFPEGLKENLVEIPEDVEKLSLDAAEAVSLDVAGVDVLVEDQTDNKFIIEANAAPAWNLIKSDTGLEVEKELLNFLANI
jgi:glutathione synthase/RimK-type ligase-like ATP-grasp enzyme